MQLNRRNSLAAKAAVAATDRSPGADSDVVARRSPPDSCTNDKGVLDEAAAWKCVTLRECRDLLASRLNKRLLRAFRDSQA